MGDALTAGSMKRGRAPRRRSPRVSCAGKPRLKAGASGAVAERRDVTARRIFQADRVLSFQVTFRPITRLKPT